MRDGSSDATILPGQHLPDLIHFGEFRVGNGVPSDSLSARPPRMADDAPLAARPTRLIGLDLLRLLAIVGVLGCHMEPAPESISWPLKKLFDIWKFNGGVGVDLFFVLSGFLVSGLLFGEYRKHGGISVSRFYLRRAWKIYPAFYFLIGATFFYSLFALGYRLRDRPLFSELLFLQSYQQGHWNHTWTLAVEEHFYLVLPIILLLFARRNRGQADPFRPVLNLVGAISLLCFVARLVNFWCRTEFSYHTHIFPTHLRMDALFFGVAIAYAYQFHADWFRRSFHPRRYSLVAVGFALIAMNGLIRSYYEPYDYTIGFTQRYVGAAGILVGVLMCQVPRNRAMLSLAALGAYSYSVYLWHMALMYYAMPQFRDARISWSIRTAVFFVGAFVIGIVMAKLVELPAIQLRDRLFPSRGGNPSVAAWRSPELSSDVRRAA